MSGHLAAPSPTDAGAQSRRLRRWSSYASLTIAVVLVIAKGLAWYATDSLSLLASILDALVDIVASLVTVLGVRLASQPADSQHRFGHGKAESLAALTQALLLAGAAGALIFDGIHRFFAPHALARLDFGLEVIAGSTLLTTLLVLFEGYVARRTKSQAIAADRSHHLTDVVANLAVLLALALTKLTGWPYFDPLFAIAIAALFGWTAFGIARTAANTLLDQELSSAERRRIRQLVMAHPDARGLHDLRTRSSGLHRFIEFHLELDKELSLRDAHAIADKIEHALKAALPASDVIVHMEPADIDDERLDDRIGSGAASDGP